MGERKKKKRGDLNLGGGDRNSQAGKKPAERGGYTKDTMEGRGSKEKLKIEIKKTKTGTGENRKRGYQNGPHTERVVHFLRL